MSESDDPEVLEELASLPTMANPTPSPDGDEIALYYDVTGRNELHVLDVETGALSQWSDGEVPRDARWFVQWAADGERVFFHRDRDGDEQNDVYAISRDGAVEPVVEMDGQVAIRDVGSDGETLLVGSNGDGQMNLHRHDLPSGETVKLTDYDRAVWSALLSPECDRIAYTTNERDDFDNRDVYVANADGSEPRNLDIGDVGAEAHPADWGPGGQRLLVGDNTLDLHRIGVYHLEGEESDDASGSDDVGEDGPITWYGDGEYEEVAVAFLPDGERILGMRLRDAESVPIVYDAASGECRELDVPAGVVNLGGMGPNDVAVGDDRIVFQHTTPTSRPELLVYDLESDTYETLLEAEYGPFDPDVFADAEYVTFRSDGVPETPAEAVDHDPYDELEIGALLYDSGRRPSPLVVNPHGGPRHRDEKSFDLLAQVLVSLGYSVLQINYRGSTGRGREFVEELYDDWGGAEQGDVATGAEHVLAEYDWLDEDRVVVFGGSYGGYSAYWQMVQYPDLYDAGVAWIGVTELEDMYENTMPHFRTELMEQYLGTPEENPDLYAERSPVTHVENLRAPLLIAHGVNDRRVPVSQARIFRDALEDAGYEEGSDYEYEELGEEGHASSDQDQKLRTFRLLAHFLERRIDAPPTAD